MRNPGRRAVSLRHAPTNSAGFRAAALPSGHAEFPVLIRDASAPFERFRGIDRGMSSHLGLCAEHPSRPPTATVSAHALGWWVSGVRRVQCETDALHPRWHVSGVVFRERLGVLARSRMCLAVDGQVVHRMLSRAVRLASACPEACPLPREPCGSRLPHRCEFPFGTTSNFRDQPLHLSIRRPLRPHSRKAIHP